jgi:hypothetical protein
VPEFDAAFAQLLDLVSDVLECAHVRDKRETGGLVFPVWTMKFV